MSSAASRFQDILKKRMDPRKETSDRPSEPPADLDSYRRVTGVIPESFWDMPMPADPTASVRAAMTEERNSRP